MKNTRNVITFTKHNKIGSIYPFISFIPIKVLFIRILHWRIRKVTLAFKLHFQEKKREEKDLTNKSITMLKYESGLGHKSSLMISATCSYFIM
jgi:hypothetical protein